MSAPTIISQHQQALAGGLREMLVDDVTQIAQRVPYIEVAPARLFDASLLSELADASDRLAETVAKLQEKFNGKQAA